METLLEIARYLLPSLVVLVMTYLIIKIFLENELKKRDKDHRKEYANTVIPLRVQAYERAILFLERIDPTNLILRLHKGDMTASQLQFAIVKSIREEYEHNMSQQLFMSDKAWAHLVNAREFVLNMVNRSMEATDNNSPGKDLAASIITHYVKAETNVIAKGVKYIKAEFLEYTEKPGENK